MVQINLLNQRRKEIINKQRLGAKLTSVGIGILLISVFISLGMVVLSARTQEKIEDIKTEIANGESKINTYKTLVAEHNVLKKRIDMISSLFSDKEVYATKLELLDRLYLNGNIAIVDRFNFGGNLSAKEFEFGGTSENLANYHQFTNIISGIIEPFSVTEIMIHSLNRKETSEFVFSYLVTL